MKLVDNGIALTKRDLLIRINQFEKALSAQALRTETAERENSRLVAEVIRLQAQAGAVPNA
jgi:hypothetical protein